MSNKLNVITTDNRQIEIDISDEACIPFGFKYGDRVMTASNLKATIKGVAPSNEGPNVLWYEFDRIPGKVCYFGGEKNLIEAGFKKLTV